MTGPFVGHVHGPCPSIWMGCIGVRRVCEYEGGSRDYGCRAKVGVANAHLHTQLRPRECWGWPVEVVCGRGVFLFMTPRLKRASRGDPPPIV